MEKIPATIALASTYTGQYASRILACTKVMQTMSYCLVDTQAPKLVLMAAHLASSLSQVIVALIHSANNRSGLANPAILHRTIVEATAYVSLLTGFALGPTTGVSGFEVS